MKTREIDLIQPDFDLSLGNRPESFKTEKFSMMLEVYESR